MPVYATPDDRVARVQTALQEMLAENNPGVLGLQQTPQPPRILNIEAAQNLDSAVRFMFRGQAYEALHVPHAHGIALAEIHHVFADVADQREDVAQLQRLLVALKRAARIFYALSRPVLPHARFWYRVGPNPFERATEGEVVALLHFFSLGRMRTSVARLALSEDQRSL